MLNDKQERFCKEYVIDLNGKQAAIRAGYSEATAENQASRMLSIVKVQQRLQELQSEIGKRLELTADMVVQELRALGFYNIQDLVDDEENIVSFKETDRDLLKPIVGFKTTTRTNIYDGGEAVTVVKEVKLADKRAALVDIGKHLGIFEKDNTQKKDVISVNFESIGKGTGK